MKKKILIICLAFIGIAATTIQYTLPTFSTTEFGLSSDNTIHLASGANTTNLANIGTFSTTTALTAGSGTVTTNLTVGQLLVNSSLTASLPVFTGSDKALASKSIAQTLLALGIQKGTATTAADGTVTNTFGTAYTVAPAVVITPVGNTVLTNSIAPPTTTNVIITTGVSGTVVNWIAIGTP